MLVKKLISSVTRDLIRPLITGAFDATNIANNILWLDTADEDTITEVSGFVSQLDDKSGLGNHAVQAIGSDQPLTGTTTQNGLNTFAYDGVNDFLQSTLLTKLTGTQCTYFVVTRRSVNVNTTTTLSAVADGATKDSDNIGSCICFYHLSGTLRTFRNATLSQLPLPALNDPYISTGMFDGSFHTIFIDGFPGTSVASTGNFDVLNFFIGARFNLSVPKTFYNGEIMEVLVYDRSLNTDELSSVHNNLSDKWAIPLVGM